MDLLAIGAGLEFNEFPSGVFRSLIALSDGIASLKLRNGSVLGEQSDVYLIGKAFQRLFSVLEKSGVIQGPLAIIAVSSLRKWLAVVA